MIVIGIIDPNPVFRLGICTLLQDKFPSAGILSVESPDHLMTMTSSQSIDLIVVNIHNNEESTRLSKLAESKKIFPGTPIVIYGPSSEVELGIRDLSLGLWGYTSHEDNSSDLENCIESVLAGHPYFHRSINESFYRKFSAIGAKTKKAGTTLSPKQLEIAEMLADGKSSSAIALELNISRSTVSTTRRIIYNKTKTENIIDLRKHLMQLY